MGFGTMRCGWIRAVVQYGIKFVLVNGSPIKKFVVWRGLRPKDLLYPFLFILAVEGIHVALVHAHMVEVFTEMDILCLNVLISHLFYVNDAIILFH